MCEFCMYKNNKHIIFGKEFEVKKCGHKTDLTSAGIMRNRDDEIPGIVIYKRNRAAGYFDITFCPMCGRKLVEE